MQSVQIVNIIHKTGPKFPFHSDLPLSLLEPGDQLSIVFEIKFLTTEMISRKMWHFPHKDYTFDVWHSWVCSEKKTEINKSTLRILILIQFALQIFAFQNLYFLWSLFHKATVFTFDILESAATGWNQFPGTVCFKNPSWSPFSRRFVRTCTFRGLVPICGCPQEIYLPFAHFHLWLIFSSFYQILGIQLLEYVIPAPAPAPPPLPKSPRYGVSPCYGVNSCYDINLCYSVNSCYGVNLWWTTYGLKHFWFSQKAHFFW